MRCVLRGRVRRDARGAAAVEFALVLPILVLLVFGIISYGYMLSFRQGISQAAAEGARAAAVTPDGTPDTEKVRSAINSALDSYGVTCGAMTSGTVATGTLKRNDANVGVCGLYVGPWEDIPASQLCDDDPPSVADTEEVAAVTIRYDYADNALVPAIGGEIFLPDQLCYVATARVS